MEHIPAPDIGDGWTVTTVERKGGKSTGHKDRYWHSPGGHKFRSKAEIQRFKEALESVGGDEVLAWMTLGWMKAAAKSNPAPEQDDIELTLTTTVAADERPQSNSTRDGASLVPDPAPDADAASNPAPDADEASNPVPDADAASSQAPDADEASNPAPDADEASNPVPDADEASNPVPDADEASNQASDVLAPNELHSAIVPAAQKSRADSGEAPPPTPPPPPPLPFPSERPQEGAGRGASWGSLAPPSPNADAPTLARTYSTYYHHWKFHSSKLSRMSISLPPGSGKVEAERKAKWAEYYASQSMRSAHYYNTASEDGGGGGAVRQHPLVVQQRQALQQALPPLSDPNAARSSTRSLESNALSILFDHAPDFLELRDIGRLSISSKELAKIVEPIWKGFWLLYVSIGAEFEQHENIDSSWEENRELVTMGGESGLLPCFAAPDKRILARLGYKRAAGCLRSKACRCGEMTARANPLTMTRICRQCANEDESSWLVASNKAKESFLLTSTDLSPLPFVEVPVKSRGDDGTVLLLLSDVKATAFRKYGSADGLAAEFEKRVSAATSRFIKSQSTSKPQKKRPKIESVNQRPCDNLRALRHWLDALPVGTTYLDFQGEILMTHATECSKPNCHVRGTIEKIVMHERVEHGTLPGVDDALMLEKQRPTHIAPTDILRVPDELKAVVAAAQTSYRQICEPVCYDLDDLDGLSKEKMSCDIVLSESGCKVCVDLETDCCHRSSGGFRVWCQLTSKGVPIEILTLGLGERSSDCTEAKEHSFDALRDTLGLSETTSGQFLAAIIMQALPLHDFERGVLDIEFGDWDSFEPNANKVPVYSEAFRLLKDARAAISQEPSQEVFTVGGIEFSH